MKMIRDFKNILSTWFSFPKNKIYCQVATTATNHPHLRTMDLYHFTNEGDLIFFSDTSTKKWLDLKQCKNIAICIVHMEYGQIIIEGEALLKTSLDDVNTVQFYWDNFLDEYWKNFYLVRSTFSRKDVPTSFGTIVVKPNMWEILEINQQDYIRSSRKRFQLIKGIWESTDIFPV